MTEATLEKHKALVGALLFLSSLAVSLVDIHAPHAFVWDEHVYIPGAQAVAHGELFPFDGEAELQRFGTGRSSWMHPPFGKYVMALAIGRDPYDARYASAVAGALSIALVFLLALELGLGAGAALFASLLFFCDGERFVFSRVAMLESLLVALVLLATLFVLRAAKGRSRVDLALFGVMAGLAAGTKWSGAAIWVGGAIFYWIATKRREGVDRIHGVASTLALPFFVFSALYLPYLTAGHSFTDVLHVWGDMYEEQVSYAKPITDQMSVALWPLYVRPMTMAVWAADPRFVVQLVPNAWVWWSTVPAAIYVLVTRARTRTWDLAFVASGVLFFWLPWALAGRTVYAYYFFPAIPLGCLCVAATLRDLPAPRARVASVSMLALAAAWFLYFTPNYRGQGPLRPGLFEAPLGNPTQWRE